MTYIVFIEDAGEYEQDWSMKEYDAISHDDAINRAIFDGYGKAGGKAWVFAREVGIPFSITEPRSKFIAVEDINVV